MNMLNWQTNSMIHIKLQRNGKVSVHIVRRIPSMFISAHGFPHIVFAPNGRWYCACERLSSNSGELRD